MIHPTISVIVPNYNDIKYLPRCLRSVLDQPDGPQQLIVIDDGSTDGSVAGIRSLIEGHPSSQLLVNPVNLGTNRTVGVALQRVSSDYVVILAANDFLLPGMFARARRALALAPGTGLWSAMAWLVDEDDQPIHLHPSAVVSFRDAYLPPEQCARLAHRVGYWFTGTTVAYHCDTLRAVGGFDAAYGAPADLFAALTVAGLRGAVFTPEPFAAIRIHKDSYSSRALNHIEGIENMLVELRVRAPRLAPQMFTPSFLERTTLRFRFACVRSTGAAALPDVAMRASRVRRFALLFICRLAPVTPPAVRVVLAFFVLRPFDVLPTLWYRLLGWILVRGRLKLRGRSTTLRSNLY
jgi:glycosyltransferase involved in cell wall biosynthesis